MFGVYGFSFSMRLLFFTAFVLLASPMAAQEITEIKGQVLDELDAGRTLVSKPGWLRGLHVIGDDLPSAQRPQIIAYLPTTWLGQIVCARITTLGGDYSATVQFEVPTGLEVREQSERSTDPSPLLMRFAFDTDYRETIAGASPDNSGVILEKGPCIGDRVGQGQEFVANFWNENSEPISGANGPAQLLMNMNVARADELDTSAVLFLPDISEPIILETVCQPISSPEALAYNHKCVVKLPTDKLDPSKDAKIEFEYRRIYRGRLSEPRGALILLGAAE